MKIIIKSYWLLMVTEELNVDTPNNKATLNYTRVTLKNFL